MKTKETEGRQPTILLVDDSPLNLGVIVGNLEEMGYHVLVAVDGEEALQRIDFTNPDLILLDVMLPGLDGFEVCRRLQAQPKTADIPVIFLTSLGGIQDKVKGFEAGAVDYITKPLQFDEVRVRIGTHLKLRALQKTLAEKNRELQSEIVERKRMEEALAAREREFRSLAENVPDNVARWDTEGRTLYSNPTHQRTLGKLASELIGKTHAELFPDGRYAAFDELMARVVADGKAGLLDRVPEFRDNGETHFHEVKLSPEFDDAGRIVSVLGLGRDMTDVYRMQEVIAAREQEFRSLAESSPDFIVRYDRDGHHRYLNTTLVKLLDLNNAEEVIGKHSIEVWPDGRFDKIDRAAEQAVECGCTKIIELTVPRESAGFEYHQICIVPERDVAGSIIGTIAFGRNVTSIREAELRLKHFIDSLPGLAFAFRVASDGHWSFPYISSSIHDFYGLQPEEVKVDAAPLHALAHPEDQTRIETLVAEARRSITPLRFDFRVCRPGMPERWLEVNSAPEQQTDGSIVWRGIMLDITERKRIEEQLRLKEFALDQAHEAAYLIGEGMRFIYVNEAACRSLGYRRDELLALSLFDIDLDFSPEAAQVIGEKLIAEGSITIEARHRRRDGSIFPVEVQSTVFEYQGQILGLALVRDITERKRTEQILEELHIQLRGLITQRETAREEERKLIARDVHDELGQILTGLKMKIAVIELLFAADSEDLRMHVKEAMSLMESAIGAVRNISTALRPVAMDMGIAAALEWQAGRFKTFTGIPCDVHIGQIGAQPEENISVVIFRIVQESLTNIARYAEASKAEISLQRDAEGYVLKISDDGKGFELGQIKSNSFGLIGIRERALMLGGDLAINSSPGNGTKIVVQIPAGMTELGNSEKS